MAVKTPSGKWRAVVRVNGRKISKNFRTRDLADRWTVKMRDGSEIPIPKADITFSDYYAHWRETYAALELAESTRLVRDYGMRKHILPLIGKLPLKAIDRDEGLALRVQLSKTMMASSANTVMRTANIVLNQAVKDERIVRNPWLGVKALRTPPPTFKFWTPDERDRFLNVARRKDPDFAELATVALFTGLRWGELYALKRKHLDFTRRQIMVACTYRLITRSEADVTKSRRVRFVPMSDEVYATLKTRMMMGTEDAVFNPAVLRRGLRRGGDGPTHIGEIAAEAHVKQIRFHDFRHTFASCLRMAGVSIETIAELLGHTTTIMAMRYAHLAPSHLAGAVHLLSVPPVSPKVLKEYNNT